MSLSKQKWYYFWYNPGMRWNFYNGIWGWNICTPLFAIGWNKYNPEGFMRRGFIWGLLPARNIKDGDYLYKFGSSRT
jgi:hypothetical protein